MSAAFIFKIVIILLLIVILISLFSGAVFLVKDGSESTRMVKSLTVRIALSIALFVLLIAGYYAGLIQPHGIIPPQEEKALP